VIYPTLERAYSESFRFDGYPVEAFVHDPETLNYFFLELDRPSGIPALPQMVLEGVEIPEANDVSRALKQRTASVISMGPPALGLEDERRLPSSSGHGLDIVGWHYQRGFAGFTAVNRAAGKWSVSIVAAVLADGFLKALRI